MERLATGMLVAALRRRVEADGGIATVLTRGEPTAGALLIQLSHRGRSGALLERLLDRQGRYQWQPTGPDEGARGDYLARRCRNDPDLWLIELDHPAAAAIVEAIAGTA